MPRILIRSRFNIFVVWNVTPYRLVYIFCRFEVNILPTSSEKNIRPTSITLYRKVTPTSTIVETSEAAWVSLIFSSYLVHSLQVLLWATFCLPPRIKQGSEPASITRISRQMGHGPLFPGLLLTNNHNSIVVMCLYLAARQTRGQAKRPRFSALRSFKACNLRTENSVVKYTEYQSLRRSTLYTFIEAVRNKYWTRNEEWPKHEFWVPPLSNSLSLYAPLRHNGYGRYSTTPFLTSALNSFTYRPFYPRGKHHQYSFNRRIGGQPKPVWAI